MDAEREGRVARNEAIFREVNERIGELVRGGHLAGVSGHPDESFEVLCECGDPSCSEPIAIMISRYERVRQNATQFLVAPGHAASEVEEVVASGPDYEVVRKLPGEGALARETDPRS